MDSSHENISLCEQREGESQLPKQEKENKTLSEVLVIYLTLNPTLILTLTLINLTFYLE